MPIINFPLNKELPETGVKPQWRNISARRLLTAAYNSRDTKWAGFVRVINSSRDIDDLDRVIYSFEAKTYYPDIPPGTVPRSHFLTVRARKIGYQKRIMDAPAIIFNCDCPRFVFHYEYALWYYGAAYLLRCNGEYPKITNPVLRVGCCKHGIAILARLLLKKF